jgi:heme oxygenase
MPDGVLPGAREELRAATHDVHERLHHIPAFAALAEGRLTRGEYAALLRRKLGFHLALERRLAEGPSVEPFGVDLAARCRSHLLRADLAWLDEPDATTLPSLPPFGSAAAALGGLYVVEGSTLGGKHLARALDAILPPGEDGRRFLLGHGARHGEMWRACCDAIERCASSPAAREAMLRGALDTFAAFEAWFTEAALLLPLPLAGEGRGGG